MSSTLSICIPYVFYNIDEAHIRDTFVQLFGTDYIKQIDMAEHTNSRNGQLFWRTFIIFCTDIYHTPSDFFSVKFSAFCQHIGGGEIVKVVYDDPWYWNCSKSRSRQTRRSQGRPFLVFEEQIPNTNFDEDTEMAEFENKDLHTPQCKRWTERNHNPNK